MYSTFCIIYLISFDCLHILLLIIPTRGSSLQSVHFHKRWEESFLEESVCFEGGSRGLEKSKCQLFIASDSREQSYENERVHCNRVPPAGDSPNCTAISSEPSAQPCNLMQLLQRGLLPSTHCS